MGINNNKAARNLFFEKKKLKIGIRLVYKKQ